MEEDMFKEFYFLGKYTELKSSKFIFDKEIEADGFRVSIAEDGSVVGRYVSSNENFDAERKISHLSMRRLALLFDAWSRGRVLWKTL